MKIKTQLYLAFTLAISLAILAGCSAKPSRTDAQVTAGVQTKVYSDAGLQSRRIAVQAANGVVTLNGDVSSDAERAAAANDAATVEGVRTVINNLQVQQAQSTPPQARAPVRQQPAWREKKVNARPTRSPNPKPSDNVDQGEFQAYNAPPPEPAAPQTQQEPPAMPVPPPAPQKVSVPAGTQISVRLIDPLDSEHNQVGDSFHATLSAPIVLGGETVIPSGADVVGRVADMKSAGRFAGNSVLTLELTALSVNGKTYNLQTNQWSRAGQGEGRSTATKVGVGTAAGAILGGLIGGGRGAAIGAASGAGAGTGVAAAKKGQQIKLGPEAVLNFQTINVLTVTPQGANRRDSERTPLS